MQVLHPLGNRQGCVDLQNLWLDPAREDHCRRPRYASLAEARAVASPSGSLGHICKWKILGSADRQTACFRVGEEARARDIHRQHLRSGASSSMAQTDSASTSRQAGSGDRGGLQEKLPQTLEAVGRRCPCGLQSAVSWSANMSTLTWPCAPPPVKCLP